MKKILQWALLPVRVSLALLWVPVIVVAITLFGPLVVVYGAIVGLLWLMEWAVKPLFGK